jgi:hypothetical protein
LDCVCLNSRAKQKFRAGVDFGAGDIRRSQRRGDESWSPTI